MFVTTSSQASNFSMRTITVIFIFLLIAVSVSPLCLGQQKNIIGYFPSWKWRDKNALMTFDKIPFGKLTIIDYAFWHPLTDGSIAGIDTVGDGLNLWGKNSRPSLVELAHQHHVRIMLSIGGWDDSYNFPAVAASESLRVAFSHSCVDVIKKFDLDGIDIDWEFPELTEHHGMPGDKYNYTLLMRDVRDSLESYGHQIGKHLLLSAALPASEKELSHFEIDSVAEIFDMLNVMTYDYNGSWSPISGFNAPLYSWRSDDSLHNVDASFKLYTEQLQIPSSKINLGIPFYGHSFAHCITLNSPHKGDDTTLFPNVDVFYYDIAGHFDKYRQWNDSAKVPYLVVPGENTLISYDDDESVALKAQYVLDHHAGGVMIWEITGDYLGNDSNPLLDVIYSKLK